MGAQSYIPNSIFMDEERDIQLITGPNMSGKSTYMRQLAIIVILAQIGSYVPAQKAELPIFDAIYTRIGAADDLVSGQSTFMVEMMEANHAIRKATTPVLDFVLMSWDGERRPMMGWLSPNPSSNTFTIAPVPKPCLRPITMS